MVILLYSIGGEWGRDNIVTLGFSSAMVVVIKGYLGATCQPCRDWLSMVIYDMNYDKDDVFASPMLSTRSLATQ